MVVKARCTSSTVIMLTSARSEARVLYRLAIAAQLRLGCVDECGLADERDPLMAMVYQVAGCFECGLPVGDQDLECASGRRSVE